MTVPEVLLNVKGDPVWIFFESRHFRIERASTATASVVARLLCSCTTRALQSRMIGAANLYLMDQRQQVLTSYICTMYYPF